MLNRPLLLSALLLIFACQSEKDHEEISSPRAKATDTIPENTASTKLVELQENKNIDYIIFGLYCGECLSNCATMYRYDVKESILRVDNSDSFFRHKEMSFGFSITDTTKKNAVVNLLNTIPDTLFKTKSKRFGCPDCHDQCGIYLEFSKNKVVKKFHIDTSERELDSTILALSNNITMTIDKVNRKESALPKHLR